MYSESFKNFIGITASICTILQFLTGSLECFNIIQAKTTGDQSALPFISGFLSSFLWLRYSFFLNDQTMILINVIGSTLYAAYVAVFYLYSIKKSVVLRQSLLCTIFLVLILVYVNSRSNLLYAQEFIGVICCFLSVLFFASPLINLWHIFKCKSSESLPFTLILSSFIVSIQWFIYGVILDDIFIKVPNLLGCLLSGFQLALFYIYPSPNNNNTTKKGYSNEFI